jgi:hypothetical protein
VDAFSSSDPLPPGPLPYADITNPQSLNKYTYTYNNPLRYTDPDGHFIDTLIDIGSVVYSASAVVADVITGSDQLKTDLKALGGDIVGAVVPGLTGVGAGVRAAAKAADKANLAADLAKAADKAHDAVGAGKGGAHGTKVHTAFQKEVDALGKADLSTEVSYKGGKVVDRGTKGSVRPDVVQGAKEKPKAIHDLKTGNAKLTDQRKAEIRKQLPPGSKKIPIEEVR